ncbi:hypothetical protein DRV84_02600 [Rhodosalinus sediminis]|uniref:Type I secretion protein n=1 Tax=Rhodosalinus sediminis TaxID=1940533 RepID=A0A3D9BY24_9RHOB|nr:hypothetical protein [Rhodosalinus sediminis]REC58470.1 hypothetical protein DRV84_02600 [Rhodosalinus sediminis]
MFLDRTTETIWHFLGLMRLFEAQDRQQISYDPFDADRAPPELDALTLHQLLKRFEYAPPGYDPEVADRPSAPDLPAIAPGVPLGPLGGPGDVVAPASGARGAEPVPAGPVAVPAPLPEVPFGPGALAPNMTVTVTVQINHLSDRDTLDGDAMPVAAWHAVADAMHDVLAAGVAAASPLDLSPFRTPAEATTEAATALIDGIAGEADAAGGRIATGDDAAGLWIDGLRADTLPRIADLMPERTAPGADAPPGQAMLGETHAINAASVLVQRIDAPTILVRGEAVALDMVSQVSLHADPGGGTTALNAAALTPGATAGDGPGASLGAGWPMRIETTVLDGDLLSFSWTRQVNALDDTDAVWTTSAAAWLQTGANTAVNISSLFADGMLFDLIVVGGDMVSLFGILQTNALSDLDAILWPGAEETPDNLLANSARLTHQSTDTLTTMPAGMSAPGDDAAIADAAMRFPSALMGDGTMRVLHVTGDFKEIHVVEQANTLVDHDMAHIPGATAISEAGNALVNEAMLQVAGVDSQVIAGGGAYTDAVLHQAGLIAGEAPGTEGAALASEAVVFLADELLGEGAEQTSDPGTSAQPHDDMPADPMQTMLA